MGPEIRFCTSSDGTRLAYSAIGDGPPLVLVPVWSNNLELDWEIDEGREFMEGLAQNRRLITYDLRGVGSSQRDIEEISLEALVADLTAIVDHLQLDHFDLAGCVFGTHIAIVYAAQHPGRVSRLVLWAAIPSYQDLGSLETRANILDLVRRDPSMARRVIAGYVLPSERAEAKRWLSRLMRDSLSAEMLARYYEYFETIDVRPFLPKVTTPTLAIHHKNDNTTPISAGRAAVALMPDARFVPLEGDAGHYFFGHSQWMNLVRSFLDEDREQGPSGVQPVSRDVHTILFTDMESSTALRQQLGDAKAQELVRTHNAIVREALKKHGGNEIKHTGDGIMSSFSTASSALECSIAIQRGVAAHLEEHPDSPLGVYVGLNAGEPIAEEQDLFGTSVDLAARICDHAEQGQILASDVVRQLAAGKDFLFSDIGETELRGFEDPVKLWEVRWREQP